MALLVVIYVGESFHSVIAYVGEKQPYIRNSVTILSTGSQFGLFYCSLNADSFELRYVTATKSKETRNKILGQENILA